jgi:flagellar motor switch protein FliM
MNESFKSLHKDLSLVVSDELSSRLKINVDFKNIKFMFDEYKKIRMELPEFSFISIFKRKKKNVLCIIDPLIVYSVSNRILGGAGVIESKPESIFTFSEQFAAEKITSIITDFLDENKLSLTFVRQDYRLNLIHAFYPDEKVFAVKMNSVISNKMAGAITLCYPILSLKGK